MPDSISLMQPEELSLQIENIAFRLLIHKNRLNDHSTEPQRMLYTTMHSHISSEFFVCVKGEITLKTPDRSIVLTSGDSAIIPPGIKHYKSDILQGSVGYTVSFLCHKRSVREGADLYKHIAPFVSGSKIVIFRSHPEICETVEDIIKGAAESKLISSMHMIELLLKLASIPAENLPSLESEAASELQGNDIQRMMKLDQLINVFFMRDFDVDEIASNLYISTRQLDRIVRKRYGKTLRAVIIDKRIDTASEMLISTDLTVTKVGEAVGFGSKCAFYREFVKKHGMTPAEYRKNNKKI